MGVDPQDKLVLSEVGEWTLEKHARLRRYIDISRKVRQKFNGPGKAGATFIDLYCGPGRSRIAGTDKIIDGSPIVAYEAARTVPFTALHLADVEEANCEAALARIRARGGEAKVYVGPAEETVERVCSALDPHALHFAFLDPFGLGALPFSVITAPQPVRADGHAHTCQCHGFPAEPGRIRLRQEQRHGSICTRVA